MGPTLAPSTRATPQFSLTRESHYFEHCRSPSQVGGSPSGLLESVGIEFETRAVLRNHPFDVLRHPVRYVDLNLKCDSHVRPDKPV